MMSGSTATSQGGDERGFRLFESYRTYLLIVARRRMGARSVGPKSASDFVQESILAAVEAEGQGRGPKPTEDDRVRWLSGILRNKINTALNREAIRRHDSDPDKETPDPGSSPSAKAIKREGARRLVAALDRLSPEDRQLIDWSLEGLTRREIGELLSVSASYASQICRRARQRLREELNTSGGSSV